MTGSNVMQCESSHARETICVRRGVVKCMVDGDVHMRAVCPWGVVKGVSRVCRASHRETQSVRRECVHEYCPVY
jgi:hypothetical protein